MLKVDSKKAYHSVEWPFLHQVFINWIMSCVTTVSYSIVVNGLLRTPFPAKKGLGQGDTLLPFLFALGMEYLSRCLGHLKIIPDFSFHARLGITHLMFAYDLLLFARADHSSLQLMFEPFTKFFQASGLVANLTKSDIYLAISHTEADLLLVQIPVGTFPFKCLGVPLTNRKFLFNECKLLLDKVNARVKKIMVS